MEGFIPSILFNHKNIYNLEKALKEEIKLRKLEKKNPFKTRNEIIDLSKGWKIYDV